MGRFVVNARDMDKLTPKGIFKHEKQLESILDELISQKIGWDMFVHNCTSLAENITELCVIGGFMAIVASNDDIQQIIRE